MMPDREKVTYDIERCICRVPDACRDCSHYQDDRLDCMEKLLADALALLKEQEAFKPLAKENDSYECICGAIVGFDELDAGGIVQIRFDYCPFCGKHISWEGR